MFILVIYIRLYLYSFLGYSFNKGLQPIVKDLFNTLLENIVHDEKENVLFTDLSYN